MKQAMILGAVAAFVQVSLPANYELIWRYLLLYIGWHDPLQEKDARIRKYFH